MPIRVQPIYPDFAAEIGDIDLAQPLGDQDWAAIDEAFHRYGVLVFPDQSLDGDQHLAFARRFGPIEDSAKGFAPDNARLRLARGIADVSNLDLEGKVWSPDSKARGFQLGNQLWHTDSTFRVVPARVSLLYGCAIAPVGGQTEFADMRAAYDALPDGMKAKLEDLVVEHSITYSRARMGYVDFGPLDQGGLGKVPQVMIRRSERTGRAALYLAAHAGRIYGMPDVEAKALIDELLAHATQRRFLYLHRWRQNDLVMWDNRCTMHRGRPFEDLRWRRDFRRATVSDEIPSCERRGLAVAAA
ncbi:MAG: TauD/TfdA family dioxygenase [Alphaproteobacteria bacterium]|nr:TauD/TfdA family dioxygenase [Alphaproteobacteria bacterium]